MKRNKMILSIIAVLILSMIGIYLYINKPFNVFLKSNSNQKDFEPQNTLSNDIAPSSLDSSLDITIPTTSDDSSVTPTTEIETLDDAVTWYLKEIRAHHYLEGFHFVYSYRILDSQESADSITIYAFIKCHWLSLSGKSVSGSSGLTLITFNTENNQYEYVGYTNYGAQQIPGSTEIPQKVKDAILDDTIYTEMRSEIEKGIADFLESTR